MKFLKHTTIKCLQCVRHQIRIFVCISFPHQPYDVTIVTWIWRNDELWHQIKYLSSTHTLKIAAESGKKILLSSRIHHLSTPLCYLKLLPIIIRLFRSSGREEPRQIFNHTAKCRSQIQINAVTFLQGIFI